MNVETLEHELQVTFHARKGAGLLLRTFEQTSRFGNRDSLDIETKSFLVALRKEVAELLCTSSKKYRKERQALARTAAPAIGVLTAFLTSRFGLAAGTATAVASAALLVPLKLTVQSWCSSHRASPLLTTEEFRTLKDIANK